MGNPETSTESTMGWPKAGHYALLLAILLLAGLFRTWNFNTNPPGVFCDEADVAWKAWCLWKTGSNERGDRLPILLPGLPRYDSVTDGPANPTIYRCPLFVYSCIPGVAMFGLTPAATRLTLAVWGLLGVVAAWLLAGRLAGRGAALIAAFLLAVSPWAVVTGRLGFEIFTVVPVMTLGLYFFLRGGASPRAAVWWAASGFTIGLASYAYEPGRLMGPVFMACLAVTHIREIWNKRGSALIWVMAAGLTATPLLMNLNKISIRFQDVSVFNQDGRLALWKQQKDSTGVAGVVDQQKPPWPFNSAFMTAVWLYPKYWTMDFLLLHGDANGRHTAPGMGHLYWTEVCFGLIGLFTVAVRSRRDPMARFLLAWTILWPLPGILTASMPHALRTILVLPLPQILAAAGIMAMVRGLRSPRTWLVRMTAGLIVVAITGCAFELMRFRKSLFHDYPIATQRLFQREIRDAFTHAISQLDSGRCQSVWVSPGVANADIFTNYWGKLDPPGLAQGEPGPLRVGRPPAYGREVLLIWNPGDFFRLFPVASGQDPSSRKIPGATVMRIFELIRQQAEWVNLDNRGIPTLFVIRADVAYRIWRASSPAS